MAGNPWLQFVKDFRKRNSGLSLKDSLKKASVEYKKQKKAPAAKKKPQKKSQKGQRSKACRGGDHLPGC